MLAITALGYEEFFVLLLPTLYWCVDQMVGLRAGIILMSANTFNTFFKFLFHSPRPYWISDDVIAYSHETSFGLPSGHAQIAASVWGWLAVDVKKRWFTIVAVVLIFSIGISRLYLGVHFFSDVLLGWFLGVLLVFLFMRWQEKNLSMVFTSDLVVLYFGLGFVFPDNADFLSYTLQLLCYSLIGLWVSWLGPVLFEKLGILEFEC